MNDDDECCDDCQQLPVLPKQNENRMDRRGSLIAFCSHMQIAHTKQVDLFELCKSFREKWPLVTRTDSL